MSPEASRTRETRPVRDRFLPFRTPSISDEDVAAVVEVLRRGWITTGPNVAAFENEVGAVVGASGSAALASATAGMHLVLSALGIGPGDEEITPSPRPTRGGASAAREPPSSPSTRSRTSPAAWAE